MILRLLISCIALLLAATIAELVAGGILIEDGRYAGRPLPPFATFADTALRERMAARVAVMRANSASPNPRDRFDRELGWVPRPGKHVSPYETGRINSIGARGSREYPPLPTTRSGAGIVRLVCVGDSFVFGSEVPDDATWPARLEQIDPGLEVINLGVGGYGTDQALLRYRRDGRTLGPDIAILGLMLEDIGRNVSRLNALHYPETRHPLTGDLDARGIEYLDASKSLLAAPERTQSYLESHFSPEANTIVANAVLG